MHEVLVVEATGPKINISFIEAVIKLDVWIVTSNTRRDHSLTSWVDHQRCSSVLTHHQCCSFAIRATWLIAKWDVTWSYRNPSISQTRSVLLHVRVHTTRDIGYLNNFNKTPVADKRRVHDSVASLGFIHHASLNSWSRRIQSLRIRRLCKVLDTQQRSCPSCQNASWLTVITRIHYSWLPPLYFSQL